MGSRERGPRLPARVSPLLTVFLVVTLFLYVRLSVGTPICFDDCHSYITLMGRRFPGDYWQATQHLSRSWFTPVVFSLFGRYNLASATSIVVAQTLLLYLAWIVFAATVSKLFEGVLAKVAFVAVSLSMYAQQYFSLNKYLLSDSLAMSTLLFHLSAVLGFRRLRAMVGPTWAIVVVIVTALFAAAARDATMSIVALSAVYLAITARPSLSTRQAIACVAGLLAVVVNQAVDARSRHEVNVHHILVGFVLPSEDVRQFFVDRGLPATAAAQGTSFAVQPWCDADIAMMSGHQMTVGLDQSYVRRASTTWALWLVTHPRYVVTHAYDDLECILGQSFASSPPLTALGRATEDAVFPRPNDRVVTIRTGVARLAPSDFVPVVPRFWLSVLGTALLAVLAMRRREPYLGPSLFLVFGGAGNAVASYFSDLWEPSEMLRHALVGSVLFNVGFVLLVLSLADLGREWLRATRRRDGHSQIVAGAGSVVSSGSARIPEDARPGR